MVRQPLKSIRRQTFDFFGLFFQSFAFCIFVSALHDVRLCYLAFPIPDVFSHDIRAWHFSLVLAPHVVLNLFNVIVYIVSEGQC